MAVGVTATVVAVAAALMYAIDIFLILFLGVLFGVFLARVSKWISDHSMVNYTWSLTLVVSSILLVTVLGFVLFGMQVNDQVTKASEQLNKSQRELQKLVDRYPSIKSSLSATPFLGDLLESDASSEMGAEADESSSDGQQEKRDELPNQGSASSATSESSKTSTGTQAEPLMEKKALRNAAKQGAAVVGEVFRTTFGLIVNSMLIFFMGLFLAVSPDMYRDGIVVLFPPERRDRTREVMDMMGRALWRWLIGRFGSMLVTGVGAGILLLVLGVPMAGTLGVLTALLTFIPNIGGLIALSLAVLFGMSQGGTTVGMVVGGYIALQLVESYIVTPLIQQKQVSLPPALLISFQVVMGVLFGFLGAAVASPLLAASKVGIEEAYVKDVLESSRQPE